MTMQDYFKKDKYGKKTEAGQVKNRYCSTKLYSAPAGQAHSGLWWDECLLVRPDCLLGVPAGHLLYLPVTCTWELPAPGSYDEGMPKCGQWNRKATVTQVS